MLNLPLPYYTLPDAAARLGVDVSSLLHLAETDQIELCFVLRWLPEPGTVVRYYKVDRQDESRVIERGEMMPGGTVLVYLNYWDLLRVLSEGRADVEGGIDYERTGDEAITYLCWSPASRTVTLEDIRMPAHELESLRKASGFYDWAEGLGRGQEDATPVESLAAEDGCGARDESLPKGERQAHAIMWAIRVKGFSLMAVPDGEKGTLERLCRLEYPELFGADTAFDNAWRKGAKKGLWRIASWASYGRRSKV